MELLNDIRRNLSSGDDISIPVLFFSLQDLLGIAISINGNKALVKLAGKYVTMAPSIKPKTKTAWLNFES